MQHITCALHDLCLMSNNGCNKQQENRHLADIVVLEELDCAAGDFNFDVSTEQGKCQTVMDEITSKNALKYLPALAYHNGHLCQDSHSNVHVRTARHCYDRCLVPDTNETFSAKFVTIPGDLAYLLALQSIADEDGSFSKSHVVHYHNRKHFDHRTIIIESW